MNLILLNLPISMQIILRVGIIQPDPSVNLNKTCNKNAIKYTLRIFHNIVASFLIIFLENVEGDHALYVKIFQK